MSEPGHDERESKLESAAAGVRNSAAYWGSPLDDFTDEEIVEGLFELTRLLNHMTPEEASREFAERLRARRERRAQAEARGLLRRILDYLRRTFT